jgi:hypothetical protein
MTDPPPFLPSKCGDGEARKDNTNFPHVLIPHGMATLINLWMRFWTAFGSGSQHQSRASYCRHHNRRLPLSFIPMPGPQAHAAFGDAHVKALPVRG